MDRWERAVKGLEQQIQQKLDENDEVKEHNQTGHIHDHEAPTGGGL